MGCDDRPLSGSIIQAPRGRHWPGAAVPLRIAGDHAAMSLIDPLRSLVAVSFRALGLLYEYDLRAVRNDPAISSNPLFVSASRFYCLALQVPGTVCTGRCPILLPAIMMGA